MFKRDELPIETGFGVSETASKVSKINELITHYTDSIIKLKNEIMELQNFSSQSKIISSQYADDMQYILLYKLMLNAEVNKLKSSNPQYTNGFSQQAMQQYQGDPNSAANLSQSQLQANQQYQDYQNSQQNEINNEIKYTIEPGNPFFNKNTVQISYLIDSRSVICAVQFDPSGRFFAFSNPRNLHIVDVKSGSILCSPEICSNYPRSECHSRDLKFSPDGTMIAVAIAPSSIGIFKLATQQMINNLEGHIKNVSSLLFTPDSSKLISGGSDGIICVWDMKTMKLLKKITNGTIDQEAQVNKEGAIASIVCGPGGSYFAVGFSNGMVGIYDRNFDRQMFAFQAHNEMILALTITNKGELVTASGDKTLKIWQISQNNAQMKRKIEGHSHFVTCACTSFTSPLLLSGSKDETIRAYNYEKNTHLFTACVHTNTVLGIAHHPKENMFVTSSGDGLVIAWTYKLPPNF